MDRETMILSYLSSPLLLTLFGVNLTSHEEYNIFSKILLLLFVIEQHGWLKLVELYISGLKILFFW